jgi:hypothetical protein
MRKLVLIMIVLAALAFLVEQAHSETGERTAQLIAGT